MSKILVFSHEIVFLANGTSTGPGLRAFEMARALKRRGHNVTLAGPKSTFKLQKEYLRMIEWNKRNLSKICKGKDVVIVPQSYLAYTYFKKVKNIPTVVDLYDPVLICTLNTLEPNSRDFSFYSNMLRQARFPFLKGDFFICAGAQQRLYYLGILNVLGRINPATYHDTIIVIVPTAAPDELKNTNKRLLKRKIVSDDTKIILWPGGIYSWFDATTPIKAMSIVQKEIKNAALIFVGAKNPITPSASESGYSKTLDEKEKFSSKNIYFSDWVPYHERASIYSESEFAVITHKEHLETELSFRTRAIDCLWGGIPLIITEGGEVSDLVKEYSAGYTIAPGDYKDLAQKIIHLLENPSIIKEMSKNVKRLVNERLNWDIAIEPLDRFCKNPYFARDKTPLFKKTIFKVVKPKNHYFLPYKVTLYNVIDYWGRYGIKKLFSSIIKKYTKKYLL